MKKEYLNNMGLQEMSVDEMKELNGGSMSNVIGGSMTAAIGLAIIIGAVTAGTAAVIIPLYLAGLAITTLGATVASTK